MEWTLIFVIIVLAVTVTDVFGDATLKEGDEGVCIDAVDDYVTKRVAYRCKGRKTCYRTNREKITKRVPVCCTGWNFRESKCVPDEIDCDPPCHNAQCSTNRTCVCETGLSFLNNTHCGPVCPPGFYNDPTDPALSCKSKCSEPCNFGTCVDFETCACFEGYKNYTQYQCEPECKTCENGVCVAPNTCNCLPGYQKGTDGKCEPVCEDCRHGICVRPGECSCNPGYAMENKECVPVCEETCLNGDCTAPNVCTCASNYTLDLTNKYKCNPICEHDCINGSCISPNICICHTGFEIAGNVWTCRPKCDNCENGRCIAPNQCVCDRGYTLYKPHTNSSGTCLPVCDNPCLYGECVAPNRCRCDEGYSWNEEEKFCKPICEETCTHGVCASPNKCKCLKGYEMSNTTFCKPLCDSCFGECVAPNVCLSIVNCKECEGICKEGECACANGTLCQEMELEAASVASTPTLAGIQLTWMLGGAVGILLLVIIVVLIHRIGRQRKSYNQKAKVDDTTAYGSVVYTVPNTLIMEERGEQEDLDPDYDALEPKDENQLGLLQSGTYVERM